MNFQNEIENIRRKLPYYEFDEYNKKAKEPFYIYGTGFMGSKCYDLLVKEGLHIQGFFETNCAANRFLFGVPVSPVTHQAGTVIISSAKYFLGMQDNLHKAGYTDDQIISPFGIFEKFYQQRYEAAFNSFDDELSKKIVIDKIKYLILEPKMVPVSAYFDEEMFQTGENAILVDGGAFDGDTAREFASIFNGKYKKIYCFEPTKSNYDLAVENLKNYERIEIINKGLYSSDTVLEFKDFGTDQWNAVNDTYMDHKWNGPAMDYEIINIPCTSLDVFFKDKSISEYPTIIKLDIEGSEKEALLGMRHVINTSHPKLIICAYHKIEDYFELTATIQEICPHYRLKLRHYSDNVLESIIFGRYQE